MKKETTADRKIKALKKEYGRALPYLLKDPIFFVRNISWNQKDPITPHQEKIIRSIHANRYSLLEAFRSSGKTSAVVQYIIYCMVMNKSESSNSWRGYVTGERIEQAVNALNEVRLHFESVEMLSGYIPKTKNVSWGKTEIELTNGARFKVKAYSQGVRSEHVDFVFGDEIGEYRDQSIWFGAVMPTVQARGGKIVGAGTPKSELDLIHVLMDNPQWHYLRFAADDIYRYNSSLDDEYFKSFNGRILYNVRYPKLTLDEKKVEIGNNIEFAREYLLKILGGGDELYPYHLIQQSFDYEKSFLLTPQAHHEYQYFMGVDFALSTHTGADYSVYCILERHIPTSKLFLALIEMYKGKSYEWQKNRIMELHALFGLTRILADEGTFGMTFLQDLKSYGLPIHGFKFQHNRSQLLETLRNMFESNFTGQKVDGIDVPREHSVKRFIMPKNKNDNNTHKLTETLVTQLTSVVVRYKSAVEGMHRGSQVVFESTLKHDDLVMGLALAYWIARPRVEGKGVVVRSKGGLMHRVN